MEKQSLGPLTQKFLEEVSLKVNPKFNIRKKSEGGGFYSYLSPFIKLFNKEVDERYITIIFGTMWVPDSFFSKPDLDQLTILIHETTHEYDRKKLNSFIFSMGYLFPQVLALLSVCSILSIWYGSTFLLFLLSFLFLLPLPAPFRMWTELRGYRTNMLNAILVRKTNKISLDGYVEYLEKQFTGAAYYWMWPFASHIKGLLMKEEILHKDEWFVSIKEWYKANGLIT
jgi:hypothetical protein